MKKILLGICMAVLVLCACGGKTQDGSYSPEAGDAETQSETKKTQTEQQTAIQPETVINTESGSNAQTVTKPQESQEQDVILQILNSMTLEEKVGQMFFVRCPENGAIEDISRYHLGGYLLFGRDFAGKTQEEVKAMTAAYQDASEIPLFIGVDEEGGSVVRISSNEALWNHKFLSPQEIFQAQGTEGFLTDTADKASMLALYGINVNFAPVCDVSTDAADFIYKRSLGQDAQATSDFAGTVVEVMQNYRIASVLKHFPGYGNNVDTHTGIAVDNRGYETFKESDFLPFLSGIHAGAEFILVSHNIVICMDSELPASLSPAVHEVLRRELLFEGIILTDDLAMEALNAYSQEKRSAVLAVLAGNDMIVTTDYAEQIPIVIEAVQNKEIDISVIDDAVYRILSIKHKLGIISR